MWKSESPCSQSTGPQVYTLAVLLLLLLRAPLTFYVVGTVRISWPRVSSNPGSFRPQYISIYYYTTIVDHYNFFSDTHIHIFRDVNYWCRQIGRYYIKAKRSLYYILDYAVARQSSTRAAASPHHFYFNSEKVGYIVLLGSAAGFLPLEKLGH